MRRMVRFVAVLLMGLAWLTGCGRDPQHLRKTGKAFDRVL